MPIGKNLNAGDSPAETKPAEAAPETKPADHPPAEDPPAPAEAATEVPAADAKPAEEPPADPQLAARQECGRYVAAFGAELGAKWFAEGVSYEDAKSKFIEHQAGEIKRLSAVQDRGEPAPVSFGAAADEAKPDRMLSILSPGLVRFANGLTARRKK